MIRRERLVELGLAVAMFLTAALVYVVPDWSVGIAILGLAAVQFGRVYRRPDWALEATGVAIWLVVLGVMTLIAPEWGVPILLVTGGVQLVRALDDLGLVVDLLLLAGVAYSRGTPLWAVAILVLVAGGKLVFLLREYLATEGVDGSTPA